MAWFWSDDLARAVLEAGVVERSSVSAWFDRPVAIAGPEDSDPLVLACELLGVTRASSVDVA